MGPPASNGVTRVPSYSGANCVTLNFRYEALTLFGCTFQCYSPILRQSPALVHNPRNPKTSGLGSFPFARRYLENRCFFLFLRLLRCFSSPGSLHNTMDSCYVDMTSHTGFPHSEIHGSKPAYGSPWLIAVNHVLHRLLVPRHSPCALYSLIYSLL